MSAIEGRATDAVRPQPPRLRPVIPHKCEAGVTPCGAKAQLYPGGWFCKQHSPAAKAA